MASSLPDDIFHTASQRFLYNIDLIAKRYANKRPLGLELDVNSGKVRFYLFILFVCMLSFKMIFIDYSSY